MNTSKIVKYSGINKRNQKKKQIKCRHSSKKPVLGKRKIDTEKIDKTNTGKAANALNSDLNKINSIITKDKDLNIGKKKMKK